MDFISSVQMKVAIFRIDGAREKMILLFLEVLFFPLATGNMNFKSPEPLG